MKKYLPVILLFLSGICSAQKYALIDKNMAQPVTYANSVTMQDDYKNLFAVEKKSLPAFIKEVEKIAKQLADKKNAKPESFEYNIGVTRFSGLKILLSTEERMDVVLTSDCGDTQTSMHLIDAKSSNANNIYYINTWIKYIKSYVKM
jgi:hypothetical protein